jgi:hypothetical protein
MPCQIAMGNLKTPGDTSTSWAASVTWRWALGRTSVLWSISLPVSLASRDKNTSGGCNISSTAWLAAKINVYAFSHNKIVLLLNLLPTHPGVVNSPGLPTVYSLHSWTYPNLDLAASTLPGSLYVPCGIYGLRRSHQADSLGLPPLKRRAQERFCRSFILW